MPVPEAKKDADASARAAQANGRPVTWRPLDAKPNPSRVAFHGARAGLMRAVLRCASRFRSTGTASYCIRPVFYTLPRPRARGSLARSPSLVHADCELWHGRFGFGMEPVRFDCTTAVGRSEEGTYVATQARVPVSNRRSARIAAATILIIRKNGG